MIKKILLTLMSIFLIHQSFRLMGALDHFGNESWSVSIFMSWVINMFITGIFAFAGFAWPTERLMPNTYYQIKAPKQLKQYYKLFGVDSFRKMLLATIWRNKKQRKKYFDGTASGIENFETQSKKSEFGHFFPLLILTGIGVYLLLQGKITLGIGVLFFNILGNFYPVLLQRHHRMRLEILKQRYG